MTVLAMLLHVDPETLKGITALLSLIAAACTATSAVHGFLNRRLRKSAQSDAAQTLALVARLVEALGVATPEQVREIAAAAAAEVTGKHREEVTAALAPVLRFAAAVELVEHRRVHRPETDVIRILEQEKAA